MNLGPVSWRCPDSDQVVVTLTPRLPRHAEAYSLCNFLGLSYVQIFYLSLVLEAYTATGPLS